jgi:hypothetical protein
MLQIDITHDLEAAMKNTDDFFWKEIPFAMSGAMIDTMYDVRRRNVGSTYPNAFTVRNKAFPAKLWRIKADGSDALYSTLRRALKAGMGELMLEQQLLPSSGGGSTDRDYMSRHASGGTKTSNRGGSVAIPIDIDRTGTGRIPIAKTPKRMLNKKNTFIQRGKSGRSHVVERKRNGTIRVWYILTPQAKINKRFQFFEDGVDTVENVFPGHLNTRMNRIIAKSRFV